MNPSPYRPRELFRRQLPDGFLPSLTKVLCDAYREAYQRCDGFDGPQKHDLLPHLRRATIERNILRFVKELGGAVIAESRPNEGQNCYHVLVRCAHAILTVSAVQSTNEMVRDAIFRRQYARSAQLRLFGEETPAPTLNGNLYGILLHKPDDEWPWLPESMQIRFPDHALTGYLDYPIDLMRHTGFTVEEVIQTPKVASRKIAETGTDGN